jgi:hypothetical protein
LGGVQLKRPYWSLPCVQIVESGLVSAGLPCFRLVVEIQCRLTRQLVMVDQRASHLGKFLWLEVLLFLSLIFSISTYTDSSPPNVFNTTYNIQKTDGEWKVNLVTAYSEKRLKKIDWVQRRDRACGF